MNMVRKKIKKPYLKYFDFIHFGISFLRERPNLPPLSENNCPLPQYLLQYALFPFIIEIKSGMKKQRSPSHANKILKNPKIKYVRENIQR